MYYSIFKIFWIDYNFTFDNIFGLILFSLCSRGNHGIYIENSESNKNFNYYCRRRRILTNRNSRSPPAPEQVLNTVVVKQNTNKIVRNAVALMPIFRVVNFTHARRVIWLKSRNRETR